MVMIKWPSGNLDTDHEWILSCGPSVPLWMQKKMTCGSITLSTASAGTSDAYERHRSVLVRGAQSKDDEVIEHYKRKNVLTIVHGLIGPNLLAKDAIASQRGFLTAISPV